MTNDYICGATIQGASISVGTIATSSLAMPTALMMTRASVSYSLTFENTSISNTSITLGDNESLYMNNVSIGSGVSLTVGTGASAYVTNSSLDLAYADVAQYISYTSDTVTITINLFDGLDVTLDGAISVNLDLSFEQYALLQTLLSSKELEVLLEGDFTMNAGTSMSFTIDTVDASGAAIEDALSIETSIGSDGSMLLTIIPEPSTATLSLLALAGLLARRRRKA
ncbi:MAG: PEP-CTERM sorting domain-containing protein [Akkermansia sp.]